MTLEAAPQSFPGADADAQAIRARGRIMPELPRSGTRVTSQHCDINIVNRCRVPGSCFECGGGSRLFHDERVIKVEQQRADHLGASLPSRLQRATSDI